jgi:hypothetical protein
MNAYAENTIDPIEHNTTNQQPHNARYGATTAGNPGTAPWYRVRVRLDSIGTSETSCSGVFCTFMSILDAR